MSSHVVGSSWPGPPAKLHIASFKRKYYADSSTEYPGLNISWLIPPNGKTIYSVLASVSCPKSWYHLESDNLFRITVVVADWLG